MLTLVALSDQIDISKQLNWRKIIIPLLLGLGASVFLLVRSLNESRYVPVENGMGDYDWVDSNNNGMPDLSKPEEFFEAEGGSYIQENVRTLLSQFMWTWECTFWLICALLMVVIRDGGYMFRLRTLTDQKLSWRSCFNSIMLWEFSSALTPSVVGGSGVAIFILNREGITLGRSTAIIFVTAILDEMFYVLMVPLVFLFIKSDRLFPTSWAGSSFDWLPVEGLFAAGYIFIFLLVTILSLSLFRFPHKFKRVLMHIFSIGILKRWLRRVTKLGDDLILSSKEIRGKPAWYWLKASLATLLSWLARFFTLNFIILIFAGGVDHVLAFGRQLIMWVIMLISPTPGSSGVAELALQSFYDDMLPIEMIPLIAVVWRLLTYFPYLFIGAGILPRWLRKTGKRTPKASIG